jgi:hypothetical protein
VLGVTAKPIDEAAGRPSSVLRVMAGIESDHAESEGTVAGVGVVGERRREGRGAGETVMRIDVAPVPSAGFAENFLPIPRMAPRL